MKWSIKILEQFYANNDENFYADSMFQLNTIYIYT